jgi:23S rRNA (cytosine1962-C5)-methyltransferase
MSGPMSYPQIALRRGSDRLVLDGHPWIYSGAIDHSSGGMAPGDIVDVVNFKGRFIGRGYYNKRSNIAARILTHDAGCPIDARFFAAAIERAHKIRLLHPALRDTNAYRIVHGESDGLPGLIVDSYDGFLVVQLHTTGIDRCREAIVEALNEVVEPRGIYERSDVGTRRADGLNDRPTGNLSGEVPPDIVEFQENGVTLQVDIRRGQKTGFFLDQRDNRLLVQRLARDRSVLDCFAYTGGFSAHALKGGARRVLGLDIVPDVARFGMGNLRRNVGESSRFGYAVTDVFKFLDDMTGRGPKFDMVVLDPPSMLRKNRDIKHATGVYIKLNRNALKLVRSGGLFVTASCSTRVSSDDFLQVVRKAASGAKVQLRILSFNLQPPDHPVDPAFPEGQYLKCIVAAVDRAD